MSELPNLDQFYIRKPRLWLTLILVIYAGLAINLARSTPPWQAPDEPAHYNYIADIATTFQLPVLRMGDYNQSLMAWLHTTKFRVAALVEQVRYESYQPPLYYLLATPVYWLGVGDLFALRLLNILIGVGIILLIYRSLELVFPGKALITVSATAFVAFLPMHLAVTATVNNDSLAELLVLASLLCLLQWMRPYFYPDEPAPLATEHRQLFILGLVLGLGLLTKIYAYALLPFSLLVILVVRWRRAGVNPLKAMRGMLWVALPALLCGLPLWVRNWRLYGPGDFLGTRWHDQVVVGQPRTIDWINQYGWDTYLERALSFTFRSFWGVFGWLNVFMDEQIYTALLLFSGVIFLGSLWALVRLITGGPEMDMDDYQLWVLACFAFLLLVVLASYIWYNLKFVQHQGRYLFWGSLPLSTYVALGWREVLRPVQGWTTAVLAGVLALSFVIIGYGTGNMQEWTILLTTAWALFLLVQPFFMLVAQSATDAPLQRWRWPTWSVRIAETLCLVTWALPFGLLALLNLLIPLLYLNPHLATWGWLW